MKISIIVPVYNEQSTIRDLLQSFDRLDFPRRELEVIVVDNGSEDRTRDIVKEFPYRLLVESDKRSSYAARNLGISHSTGEIVAFTDGDCVVSHSWLMDLARGFDDAKIGGVAGPIVPLEPATLVEKLHARLLVPSHNPRLLPYPFAVTANVAYRREAFEKVGNFDERFTTGSDVDFAIRVQKEGGFSIRFLTNNGLVFHRNERNFFELMARAKRYGYGEYLLSRRHPSYPPSLTEVHPFKRVIFRICAEIRLTPRLRDFFAIVLLESLRLAWQLSFELGFMEGRRSASSEGSSALSLAVTE